MKKSSLSAIVLTLILVLTACSGGGNNATPSASSGGDATETTSASPSPSESAAPQEETKPVTIQYWHTQVEEERIAKLKELIDAFQSENKSITVEQIAVPEEQFPNRISAALGANQLPAVIEGGIDQMLFLGTEEVTANTIHEEIINEIGKDDFYKGALEAMTNAEGGGYFGVPISGWVQGIWYNKALFAEKGLEPPTTWDNILKAAQTLHDPKNQKYGIVFGTTKDDFAEQTFSQFALSNEAVMFDQDGNVKFNSPEMVEALTAYKELAKFTPPGAETWREARELYLGGNAAMVMYSTYIMGDLSQNKELAGNTGFALPEKKTKASYGQITSFAITNTVSEEEQQAAKKFTLFMMKKENNIQFLHLSAGGSNPTRKSIAADPAYLNHPVLQAFGEVAAQIPAGLENLQRFGFQQGNIYPQMGDISAKFIIGGTISNITLDDKDPAAEAAVAQKEMEATVKK